MSYAEFRKRAESAERERDTVIKERDARRERKIALEAAEKREDDLRAYMLALADEMEEEDIAGGRITAWAERLREKAGLSEDEPRRTGSSR